MTLASLLPVPGLGQYQASWHFGPSTSRANILIQNEPHDETTPSTGLASAYRDPFQAACTFAVGDYTRTSSLSGQNLLTDCPGISALFTAAFDAQVLACGPYIGAWGVAVVDPQPWILTTGAGYSDFQTASRYAYSTLRADAEQNFGAASSGELRADRIASIQASFTFPLRVLAKVLRRSPTQLYKWLDPEEAVSLQESSERRIATIERLARSWDRRAKAPIGELRRHVLSSGKTIVDVLAADPIDEPAAERALAEIATQLVARPLSLAQRMQQKGFVRRRRHLPDDDD